MSKLAEFLSDADRGMDSATLSMAAVLDAARLAGLDPAELAALSGRDPKVISQVIASSDAAILGRTHVMVEAPEEEEEEEGDEEEKT